MMTWMKGFFNENNLEAKQNQRSIAPYCLLSADEASVVFLTPDNALACNARETKTTQKPATKQRRLEMKIKNLFKASLDVFREVHPFTLEQRFLNLSSHDQQHILNVAVVLLMAKPDMTDFLLDKAAGGYYDHLPEC